jgi:anti-sigma factor RsiW
MHDCREVEKKLVDLLFDELSVDERSRLLSETEQCPECLGAHSSMRGTMRIFDQAVEASLPTESFWPQHHEDLRQHLALNSSPVVTRHEPLWKRFFALKLRVPVPVAIAVAIALVSITVLALRSSVTVPAQTVAAQPLPETPATPRLVEVPIVHEKVVTRTVYLEKTRHGTRDGLDQPFKTQRITPVRREKEDGQDSLYTRASLTDFQPPDEMRIRIIRRSKSDEK